MTCPRQVRNDALGGNLLLLEEHILDENYVVARSRKIDIAMFTYNIIKKKFQRKLKFVDRI